MEIDCHRDPELDLFHANDLVGEHCGDLYGLEKNIKTYRKHSEILLVCRSVLAHWYSR